MRRHQERNDGSNTKRNLNVYFYILALMIAIALALKSIPISTPWQKAGLINLSIGFYC